MTHLLKLELKKFRIMPNVLFSAAAILFCMLFLTVSMVDSMTDPQQTKDDFESTFLVIGLLVMMLFLIYASVLTARLIIGEYNQRTITILFSCPINRRQLIAVKLIIIMVFTAVSMLAGYVCLCGYIVAADYAFDMLDGAFRPSFLETWIPSALACIAACAILTLWPFIVGMIRKSVPAAIITSLITIFVRQLMISKDFAYRESVPQLLLIAAVTAVFTFFTFRKKILQVY